MKTTKRVKFLGKVIDAPVVCGHYEVSSTDGPVYLKDTGRRGDWRWEAFLNTVLEDEFEGADYQYGSTPQRAVSKVERAMIKQFKRHAKLLGYEVTE